jgi:hypothetical protein
MLCNLLNSTKKAIIRHLHVYLACRISISPYDALKANNATQLKKMYMNVSRIKRLMIR